MIKRIAIVAVFSVFVSCFSTAVELKEIPEIINKILTADESNNSIIYMHLPYNQSGSVILDGSDVAIGLIESPNLSYEKIWDGGKISTFQMSAKKGGKAVLHIITRENRVHTIIATSLGNDDDYEVDAIVSKVIIK